jgi:ribosomal-protein-alanine N-acetyltransferase
MTTDGSIRRPTLPIRTERLVVRRFEPDDWRAVFEYAGDPQAMRYFVDGPFTEAQAREFVNGNCGDGADEHAVVLERDGHLVGHLVFHPWAMPRTYEIGWMFHPAHQGTGYATEAARAVLDHAFRDLGAHRAIATCQPENVASCRVAEKLGMRREGLFRECIAAPGGGWWDEYFYAVLAEEWGRK